MWNNLNFKGRTIRNLKEICDMHYNVTSRSQIAYHRRLALEESDHCRCRWTFGNGYCYIINGWDKWAHMTHCWNKSLKTTHIRLKFHHAIIRYLGWMPCKYSSKVEDWQEFHLTRSNNDWQLTKILTPFNQFCFKIDEEEY